MSVLPVLVLLAIAQQPQASAPSPEPRFSAVNVTTGRERGRGVMVSAYVNKEGEKRRFFYSKTEVVGRVTEVEEWFTSEGRPLRSVHSVLGMRIDVTYQDGQIRVVRNSVAGGGLGKPKVTQIPLPTDGLVHTNPFDPWLLDKRQVQESRTFYILDPLKPELVRYDMKYIGESATPDGLRGHEYLIETPMKKAKVWLDSFGLLRSEQSDGLLLVTSKPTHSELTTLKGVLARAEG